MAYRYFCGADKSSSTKLEEVKVERHAGEGAGVTVCDHVCCACRLSIFDSCSLALMTPPSFAFCGFWNAISNGANNLLFWIRDSFSRRAR